MKTGKMKIFIASLLLCLMLGVTVISGCSLVTTNYEEYYKAIVASAVTKEGKKIEITKKDLITAYNSYGIQYVNYYGSTKEEAIKLTLEQLIMQELVVDKVERYLTSKNGANYLSEREKTYLWESTYDSIVKNLDSYNGQSQEETSSDSQTNLTKNNYNKTAKLTYDVEKKEYKIEKLENAKTTINSYTFWSEGNKDASTALGKEEIYTMLNQLIKDDVSYAKSYSKYISELKKSEKGQNLSQENKDVMLREIERIYDVVYNGYLTTLYQEIYKADITNVDVNDMLELYKSKILNDYATYDIEKSATYTTDILDTSKELFYHQESNAEFFYVTHILVKFTAEQQARFDEYDAIINPKDGESTEKGKYTPQEAQTEINKLYNELMAKERVLNEAGEYVESENSKTNINPNVVLDEVNAKVVGSDNDKRAEAFYDLMFKYTEDDSSTLNANYQYIIGVDYTQKTYNKDGSLKYNYKSHSNMVESFTEEAIRLYNNGNGQVGDHSTSLIKSNYGVHILMYGGKVENLCDNVSFSMSMSKETLVALSDTRLNACRDYTYFDKLYDELVKDNFEVYRTKDLKQMKSELKDYTFFKGAYKDLL